MPRYSVLVYKTETYATVIDVEEDNESAAMIEAEAIVAEKENITWSFVDGTIEADSVEEGEDEEA